MNSSQSTGRGPILLLTLLLTGCGISALLHPGGSGFDSIAEMRPQSKLPGWPQTRWDLRVWPRRFETYVNDAFPGRSRLIAAGSAALWNLGWLDSDRAIKGTDGWLFLRRGQETFEKTRGFARLSPEQVGTWGERWVGGGGWGQSVNR